MKTVALLSTIFSTSPISLSKLPGISRWEILRLEEEGVESIASLATYDRANLKRILPIRGKLIDLWINTAVLMTLIGARKYECLKEICLTAENFVEQFKNGHFRKFLMEKRYTGATSIKEGGDQSD